MSKERRQSSAIRRVLWAPLPLCRKGLITKLMALKCNVQVRWSFAGWTGLDGLGFGTVALGAWASSLTRNRDNTLT